MSSEINQPVLVGPISQLLTMDHLPEKGPISDDEMPVLKQMGILAHAGRILEIAPFEQLYKANLNHSYIHEFTEPITILPGYIDAHTHLCYAGSRAADYTARIAGKSYEEIARLGGGIMSSVRATRQAPENDLNQALLTRVKSLSRQGITTIEIKSGYGLTPSAELKMLRSIQSVNGHTNIDLIATCLAAHTVPNDFTGTHREYLEVILNKLLPTIQQNGLSNRVDIFTDDIAFSVEDSRFYLEQCKALGFDIVIHADQFSRGGAELGCQIGARSVDHLECSDAHTIKLLSKHDMVATVLPGASLGLGMHMAPARKLLDAGACLAIASDANPGSAPMGDLITEAAMLSVYEKLSNAEVFAGLTYRAAKALRLLDRGILQKGSLADWVVYPIGDYREILYHQGSLKPSEIWKRARPIQYES